MLSELSFTDLDRAKKKKGREKLEIQKESKLRKMRASKKRQHEFIEVSKTVDRRRRYGLLLNLRCSLHEREGSLLVKMLTNFVMLC